MVANWIATRRDGVWKRLGFPDTTPEPPPETPRILIGVNASPNGRGGTNDWDTWRVYNQSACLTAMNRTGAERPLMVAVSLEGANLGGSSPTYNAVFNQVTAFLNTVYYTSPTGQTHTARWGIATFLSNGNENSDKAPLTLPHTPAKIAAYVVSQRALWEAVHQIDPATGQRRFPDAYAGSNPTTTFELNGIVADYMEASAQWHDFNMWSMYPPGRSNTTSNPTYNYPSFAEAQRTVNPHGYLIRCFYRTKQAEIAAREQSGDPTRKMLILCGEYGIGDDPGDSTHRPWYAARSVYWFTRLAEQYDLTMVAAHWWDDQVDAGSSQNILNDEPGDTNPSTRMGWQNAYDYVPELGGTLPANWTANPKGGWKTTGTPS